MMRPPVLIRSGEASGAFLPDGTPGTGGLFVQDMYHFSPMQAVAQILVEYAEQGHPALIVDDGAPGTGEILYRAAHMLGSRAPEELNEKENRTPLRVCGDPEGAWSDAQGVHVGDFHHIGGFEVMYHPGFDKPDDHACDMGDAHGVLLVMRYPNADSRVLHLREHDITPGPGGRLVDKG